MDSLPPAGLFRRLAAAFYDVLLLAALSFIASGLWVAVNGGPITSDSPLYPLQQLSLLLVCLAFFAGFWMHGGQTLGMRAWRLRVTSTDGGPLTLNQAIIRFFAALLSWLPLGLGFLWALIDPQRRTWHDRLSSTRLVLEPRR